MVKVVAIGRRSCGTAFSTPQGRTKMAESEPKRIKVVIYPNQLEWMNRISKIMNQPRRQTFLDCFSQFIGTFKEETGLNRGKQ
jgi:hypothetical protein